MLTWTFRITVSHGRTAPSIRILSNHDQSTLVLPAGTQLVTFDSHDATQLQIDYFSKIESDTVLNHDGIIVADTMWRIEHIWCDSIALERWFLHDCVYQPKYFQGYLQHNPNQPSEIIAPYQFNFPGILSWQWPDQDFWSWYFREKNNREVINFLDRDPDRVWKFRGNTESCDDLVLAIKKLLHL